MLKLQHNFGSEVVQPALRSALQRVWRASEAHAKSAPAVIEQLAAKGHIQSTIYHDHFAFRTFGVGAGGPAARGGPAR
jgi:hypothetical protein